MNGESMVANGTVKVVDLKKLDGMQREFFGQKEYVIIFEAAPNVVNFMGSTSGREVDANG